MVKDVTNRHTPIKVSVKKICEEVKNDQLEQEIEINKQRITNPRLMDRDFFKNLTGLITHQAIDLMSRELDAAKKIADEIFYGIESIVEPAGESCVYDCDMPLQYGLPCKCWLYTCVIGFTPIPVSLVHPRWFFDGPSFVTSWHMTLDYQLSFKDMLAGNFAEETNLITQKATSEQEMVGNRGVKERVEGVGESENKEVEVVGSWEAEEVNEVKDSEMEENEKVEEIKMRSENHGNRFRRNGLDLLHSAAYEAIDFHKSIKDAHRGEEYARDYARVTEKFNRKWKEKELTRAFLPTTFPDEIRPKENLTYKKGGSRRRAYTGREAAEVREAEHRRAQRRYSIEESRQKKHDTLQALEVEKKGTVPNLQKYYVERTRLTLYQVPNKAILKMLLFSRKITIIARWSF